MKTKKRLNRHERRLDCHTEIYQELMKRIEELELQAEGFDDDIATLINPKTANPKAREPDEDSRESLGDLICIGDGLHFRAMPHWKIAVIETHIDYSRTSEFVALEIARRWNIQNRRDKPCPQNP